MGHEIKKCKINYEILIQSLVKEIQSYCNSDYVLYNNFESLIVNTKMQLRQVFEQNRNKKNLLELSLALVRREKDQSTSEFEKQLKQLNDKYKEDLAVMRYEKDKYCQSASESEKQL